MEWTETSEWTTELRSDGVVLGRVCKNGFNVLAWGSGHEHLGYHSTIEKAKSAVLQWLSVAHQPEASGKTRRKTK